MVSRVATTVTAGGVTVQVGGELERWLNAVVDATAGVVRHELEANVTALAEAAEQAWYTQVDRRTGESGRLEVGMAVTETEIRASVRSTDTRRVNGKPVVYYVHRPGPFSTVKRRLSAEEYSELMRVFRETGKVPGDLDYVAGPHGRPLNVAAKRPNPKRADGRYLVPELLSKPGRTLAIRLAKELGPEIAAAARRA